MGRWLLTWEVEVEADTEDGAVEEGRSEISGGREPVDVQDLEEEDE